MTVEYDATEQFDEAYGDVDDTTDVSQLGVVFYELFTGQPLFRGQTLDLMNPCTSHHSEAIAHSTSVPQRKTSGHPLWGEVRRTGRRGSRQQHRLRY